MRVLSLIVPLLALLVAGCTVVGGSPNITGSWIALEGGRELLRMEIEDDDGYLSGYMFTLGQNREYFEGTRSGPKVQVDLIFDSGLNRYTTGRITGTVSGSREFAAEYLICAGPSNCAPDGIKVQFRKR